MPCSEAIVCTWKKQTRFRRAVKVLLYDDSDTLGLRATVASLGRAIRGSIKDYELYLQRTGQLPHLLPRVLVGGAAAAGANAGAVASTTVIFQGVPPPVEPLALPPTDPDRAVTVVPAPPHL